MIGDWPRGSYLVFNSHTNIPSKRTNIAIDHKYNYRKVLRFIYTEGDRITFPGVPYYIKFPDRFLNFSIFYVPRPYVLSKLCSVINDIDNHNNSRKSDIALEFFGLIGKYRLIYALQLLVALPLLNFGTIITALAGKTQTNKLVTKIIMIVLILGFLPF